VHEFDQGGGRNKKLKRNKSQKRGGFHKKPLPAGFFYLAALRNKLPTT